MDSTIWRQHRHREHPVATSEATVIKTLLVILLAVPLVSFAPVPSTPPAVYRVRLAIQTGAPAIAPLVQTCTWDTAVETGVVMTVQTPILRLIPPQKVADSEQIAPLQFKIEDTARLLSVSRRTVERLIAQDELATVGTRKLKRVPYDSIVAYLNRHRNDKVN